MPAKGRPPVFRFSGCEIDLAKRTLRLDGAVVPIGGRAFEIIEVLVQSAGDLVTKDEIMGSVWRGSIIEENVLQVHISAIRKALGPNRGLLKTVSGRGYRLVGDWVANSEETLIDDVDRKPSQIVPESFPRNLPNVGSDLIGRTAAVQQVRDLLSAYRVVTLTGSGGIGKTRLALEVAGGDLPNLGQGSLVELASLANPNLVPSAVASVLGLKLGGDEISPESVARAIGTRKLLLVIDNCEHLIEAVATLAELLVQMCPHTTILATSRELLRVEGEYVYRVLPLEIPSPHREDPDDVIEHSAIKLFIARITAMQGDFSYSYENVAAIAAICRRLDGIPLAIEFAAARASTLGVEGVASRLDDRFVLLTGGRRTALPRHRTLRATLDWSYELLPETERRLLRRLAVFSAGFTLEAATAVASKNPDIASAALEGFTNLVAKSLVTMDSSATTERWRLLETIRAYAFEKLSESGEAQQAARHHAEFFRDIFASTTAATRLRPSIEDMERYGRELDNVRAALDWSFSATGDSSIGVVLTASYAPVWLHLALMVECRERAECALQHLDLKLKGSSHLQMELHIALGVALVFTMGSVARTRAVLIDALELAQKLDDVDALLRVLWALWALRFNIGECRAARSTAKLFLQAARRTGDQAVVLVADRIIGTTLQYEGEQAEARRYFERVLDLYVAPKDQRHTIWFHYDQLVLARAMLARALWLQGFLTQAADQARRSLQDARASSHELSRLYPMAWSVYQIAVMTGDLATAARVVPTLIDLATSYNATFWKILGQCLEGKLLIKRGQFGAGSALLRSALENCDKSGWTICYPEFLGVLAEGLSGLGELADALLIADQALERAKEGGECWYLAELLRIKGELLLQEPSGNSAAEACFYDARDVAQKQGALFWELRVALSVAHLRLKQNRKIDARQVLLPVYSQFTEGFDTADLTSAKAILELFPSE